MLSFTVYIIINFAPFYRTIDGKNGIDIIDWNLPVHLNALWTDVEVIYSFVLYSEFRKYSLYTTD